ncbi:MAG: hypothetical protein H7178_04370 [Chitinophagaceae bacterium]|nr:hypothetical protein [Chitinophagaceae bacterium]
MQSTRRKQFKAVYLLFIFVTIICIIWAKRLALAGVNNEVVLVGNVLLFVLAMLTLYMHTKAAKNSNPNVLVRSIMGAMLLKMMVVGTTAIIYVLVAKQNRNLPAIFVLMGLYLVYLVIEVKVALQLNKKEPADGRN